MIDEKQVKEFRSTLRKLERVVLNNIKDDSYCCGITTNQCHILLGMDGSDGVAQSDLGNKLNIDKASLSRTMDALVKKGMVKRKISSQDRRFQDVSLTEMGEKFVNEINETSFERYQSIIQKMETEVRDRIIFDMEILIESLSDENLPERKCCQGGKYNADGN
jgi:DNA-binding MarR family transcriptional regulator